MALGPQPPDLGQPGAGRAPVPIAGGTPWQGIKIPRAGGSASDGQAGFDYYGHHQFFAAEACGRRVGVVPEAPVMAHPQGARSLCCATVTTATSRRVLEFEVLDGSHDVGLLFRVTRPGVEKDARRS